MRLYGCLGTVAVDVRRETAIDLIADAVVRLLSHGGG